MTNYFAVVAEQAYRSVVLTNSVNVIFYCYFRSSLPTPSIGVPELLT